MDITERAEHFLRRTNMHPDCTALPVLAADFREEMERGLRGERCSLGLLPSYFRCAGQIARETPVLVMDAGGTRLRTARMHFDEAGRPVTEELRRRPMPGTEGELSAAEFFEALGREAAALGQGCQQACISFSYPCRQLSEADGRLLRLTKELTVPDLPGSLICAPLEAAVQRLGLPGRRRWRMINDTVGTLLGGLSLSGSRRYDDYIGFIQGTGTNTCCQLPAEELRSPEPLPQGDMIVNLESGGFSRLTRGEADLRLDRASQSPGEQQLEKMCAGGYLSPLLRTLLLLALEEGELPGVSREALESADIHAPDVDRLCTEEDDPLFTPLLGEQRPFAAQCARRLLERSGKLSAGVLAGIADKRALGEGQRLLVCADGSMFAKSPLLRPFTEQYLAEALSPRGAEAEFLQVPDASLLGSACAGLLG